MNHFRKDFIRPCGLAHDGNYCEDPTLSRRLNKWNCEFYLRPQVGISESTQTFSENTKYLEKNNEILDEKSLSAFINKTKKLDKHLAVLDSKNTGVTSMSILSQILCC